MKRIAIITGASSGIGREFLKAVAKEESFDEIWAIARREDRLLELREETALPIVPLSLDLSLEESFSVLQNKLEEEKPNVALLANISGYGKFGATEEIPLYDSLGMIDLNCKALTAVTKMTLPYIKKGGKILEFDSISAFHPVPYINVYAATKAYVLSFTRGLSRELAPRGIRVMAACPFWVKTEFFNRAENDGGKEIKKIGVVYEAAAVAKTTVKHLYHSKRDVSVHGAYATLQSILVKILPHSLVMWIWLKSQGKR
ncbi:MAG: SDR family NAD(P)-dependent oxidoreductase [Oscillospiraceae bacterium]|nr:SDR family NAD(P)-dependent oxidoreductase [Oscillospiraceae bacterium]